MVGERNSQGQGSVLKRHMTKTGIVDVGGGMRDIYGAGIFDYCLDAGITFDCCVGVSAGRAEKYNRQLDLATRLEKQGTLLILAPDDIGKMKTLTKDREEMEKLYQKGYSDGDRMKPFLTDGDL